MAAIQTLFSALKMNRQEAVVAMMKSIQEVNTVEQDLTMCQIQAALDIVNLEIDLALQDYEPKEVLGDIVNLETYVGTGILGDDLVHNATKELYKKISRGWMLDYAIRVGNITVQLGNPMDGESYVPVVHGAAIAVKNVNGARQYLVALDWGVFGLATVGAPDSHAALHCATAMKFENVVQARSHYGF